MASIPFYNDIDLNNNKIKNFTVDTLDQAPTNPNKGQQYYNTADNKLYYYNGTEWVTGATSDSSDVSMPYDILSLTNDSTADEINTAFGSTENIALFKNTIKNHKGIVFVSTPINYVSTVYSIAVDYVVTSSAEAYIVKTIYNNNYVTYQFANAKDANTFNSIKVTTTPIETPQVDNFKYTTSADIVSETPTFGRNDLKNLINDAILDEHYYLYYSGDNIFTTSLNIDTTTTSGSSIITLYVNGCTREHKYINYTVVGTITGTAEYGTELTSSQYNEFNTSKVITITYNQDLSQKSNYFKFSKSTLANRVDYTSYTSAQILSRIITKEEIRFLVNNFRNLYKYRFIVGSNLYVNVKASAIDTMLNINFNILNNGDQYISYGISSEIDESITLPVTDSVLDKICNNLTVGDKIVFDLSQEITNIDVVDNLNSESTTDALSANQGKTLNEKIDNAPKLIYTKVTSQSDANGFDINDITLEPNKNYQISFVGNINSTDTDALKNIFIEFNDTTPTVRRSIIFGSEGGQLKNSYSTDSLRLIRGWSGFGMMSDINLIFKGNYIRTIGKYSCTASTFDKSLNTTIDSMIGPFDSITKISITPETNVTFAEQAIIKVYELP